MFSISYHFELLGVEMGGSYNMENNFGPFDLDGLFQMIPFSKLLQVYFVTFNGFCIQNESKV